MSEDKEKRKLRRRFAYFWVAVLTLGWLLAGVAALAESVLAGLVLLAGLAVYLAGETLVVLGREPHPSVTVAWLVTHRLALGTGVVILAVEGNDSNLGLAIGVGVGCLIAVMPIGVFAIVWLVMRLRGRES